MVDYYWLSHFKFFCECRLIPQLQMAEHWLDTQTRQRCDRLLEHLDTFLEEPAFPSLLHGDLWSGNVVCGPDEECLQKMADKIREKLISGSESVPMVLGGVPEKSGMNIRMAPGTTESCTKCGLCAEKCPVGAIDAKTLEADKKKCISCMRCISVCLQEARKLNVVIASLEGVAPGVLCKKRKECELFL